MQSILNIPLEHLTPGMRQYRDIKEEYKDCIVMLRMGDFYEMFYEDAITCAKELDITLTKRGKGVKEAPLSGVPHHAIEPYLGRLVKKGYKVAIVEQLENPALAKGLVKRGVVRVVTAGTLVESNLLNDDNNYLAALTQKIDGVHLARTDMSTSECAAGIFKSLDDATAELARLGIVEVIIPQSLQVNTELNDQLKMLNITARTVNDAVYTNHNLQGTQQAAGAVAALLYYLRTTQFREPSINKVEEWKSTTHMFLDRVTLKNLELLSSVETKGSLYSILNHCVTAHGKRTLKHWLSAPLLDTTTITQRQQKVEALLQKSLRDTITTLLSKTSDIERIVSRAYYAKLLPKDCAALRNTLRVLPQLSMCTQRLNYNITHVQTPFLLHHLNDPVPSTIKEGGMFTSNANEELARLRTVRSESKQMLADIEQEVRDSGVPTVKIGYNRVFGYYIEVPKKYAVPEHLERKQTTSNAERYTTPKLKKIEHDILNAESTIIQLEKQLFDHLAQDIVQVSIELKQLAVELGELDVLCSFAQTAQSNRYCRPQFGQFNIVNGRHPVLEQNCEFIPNTVSMNKGELMMITGPNTAGKSTVMRQTALILLLAQCGSFVPADRCSVPIIDRIFTRVGAHDELVRGHSTFMVEMLETAQILKHATPHSFVLMDEVGRGTSTKDGCAIARAVAEHLVNVNKAYTMFSTHYHELADLGQSPNVRNCHMAIKEIQGDILFLRKLVDGNTDKSFGIHVAKMAGLPQSVINNAERY